MTPDLPTFGRGLLVCSAALVVGLGLSGCGRRGPLEPPPGAAAPAAPSARPASADGRLRPTRGSAGQAAGPSTALATRSGSVVTDAPGDDDDESDTLQSVLPTPNPTPRRRPQPYVVPTDPFILDPLL